MSFLINTDQFPAIAEAVQNSPLYPAHSTIQLYLETARHDAILRQVAEAQHGAAIRTTDNPEPYEDANYQATAMRNRGFHVSHAHAQGHPIYTPEEIVTQRIVHDWFGHGGYNRDQDVHSFQPLGEIKAYYRMCRLYPRHLHPVLFSEYIGHTAYLHTTKQFSPQFAAILPHNPRTGERY